MKKKSRFVPITDWIEVDSTSLSRHYTQKTFITINRLILFLIRTSLLIIVLLSKSPFREECFFYSRSDFVELQINLRIFCHIPLDLTLSTYWFIWFKDPKNTLCSVYISILHFYQFFCFTRYSSEKSLLSHVIYSNILFCTFFGFCRIHQISNCN